MIFFCSSSSHSRNILRVCLVLFFLSCCSIFVVFFFVLPIQNHFDIALYMHWHFEQIKKGSINSIHLANRNPNVSYVLLTISLVHSPNLPFHFPLLMNFFFLFLSLFHFCAFSIRLFYALISMCVFHQFISMYFFLFMRLIVCFILSFRFVRLIVFFSMSMSYS